MLNLSPRASGPRHSRQHALQLCRSSYKASSLRSLTVRVQATAAGPIDVVVIGGGIGGLVTAKALLETGARVRVYEGKPQHAALDGPGGINVQSNAEKVLRLLPAAGEQTTLSDAIYTIGGPILSGGFRDRKDGSYLYYADVDSTGLTDVKSNGLCISRRSLQSVLYSALPSGCVTFNKPLQSFNAPPSGDGKVTVTFADGTTDTCDILVGADGVNSKVRKQLFASTGASEPSPLRYSGTACWRGCIALDRIGKGKEWFMKATSDDTWGEFWGVGSRIGWFLVGGEAELDEGAEAGVRRTEAPDQLAWYAFALRPEDYRSPTDHQAIVAEMRQTFGSYCSPVPELLDALAADPSATIYVDRIYDRKPTPAPWGQGRVTLLGDAAHPMVPTLGQGGCMAIEDSLELANVLGEAVAAAGPAGASWDVLAAALRSYEASRAPRVARVINQSAEVGQLANTGNPIVAWIRDLIYKSTTKEAGDKQFAYLFKDYVPAWTPNARKQATAAAASAAAPLEVVKA